MDNDRKKVVLFAAVGAALPVIYTVLLVIFSDMDTATVIFLLISAVYSGFAVKNFIDLKTQKKEHNSPIVVGISVIMVLITVLFTVVFLIALLTGNSLISRQR